jgi:subtilisin family serine protease
LGLLVLGLLAHPPAARGQLTDAVPTWWHEAAGLTPLLTAPPPENPATICLIDTGVTPTPDLDITARWAYDGGTLDDIRETEDSPGHGTLVAHFAAGAVNGWGGAGAFPHARISSVRVFPREGGASWREYIAAISRCLKLDANTKVIVISIGGQDIEPGEADELEHWIVRARDRYDVNVVAAAGNGGQAPDFPGRFSAAFTVAALSEDGTLCPFSARGIGIDLAAPGCGVRQAGSSGHLWQVQGTSFSAPIVAGALAALRSYTPRLSAREAEAALVQRSHGGDPPQLDARDALADAGVQTTHSEGALENPQIGARPLPGAGAVVTRPKARGFPAPRVRVRRTHSAVVLVARNRPRGVWLEVRSKGRRVRRRSNSIRVQSRAGAARCRFISAAAGSPWTTVRW